MKPEVVTGLDLFEMMTLLRTTLVRENHTRMVLPVGGTL
jgi:hypothetical protein